MSHEISRSLSSHLGELRTDAKYPFLFESPDLSGMPLHKTEASIHTIPWVKEFEKFANNAAMTNIARSDVSNAIVTLNKALFVFLHLRKCTPTQLDERPLWFWFPSLGASNDFCTR